MNVALQINRSEINKFGHRLSFHLQSVQGAFLAFGANKQTRKKARASVWGGAKEVLVKFPGRKKIREPEEIGTGNGRNRK